MKEWIPEDDKFDTISKYEEMLSQNKTSYFDIEEFEDIIDFYIDNENITKAKYAIKLALKQHPFSESIKLRQAIIYLQNTQIINALSILTELIKINPNQLEVLVAYATALIINNEEKKANKYLDKALDINKEESSEILYRTGLHFLTSGKYDYSIKLLETAYKNDSGNFYILNDIAFCYERLEKHKESIEYYKKYLNKDPFDEIIWYNLGIIYERAEETNNAIDAYDYAIAINPKYELAFYSKANLLISLEKYEEAIELFLELSGFVEEKADIYCLIGECYEKTNHLTKAHEYYKKSLYYDKTYADAWFGIGMIKAEREEFFESLYYLQMAIKYDKSNEEFYLETAKVYQELGFLEDAEQNFKKAVEIAPYDDEIWSYYAEMFLSNKNYEKARDILYEAKSNIADSANIIYKLAVSEVLSSNFQTGFKLFKQALEIDYKLHKKYLEKFPELHLYEEINKIIIKKDI